VADVRRRIEPQRFADPESEARRSSATKIAAPHAPSAQLEGLAVNRDPLGAHLVLLDIGRIAEAVTVLPTATSFSVAPRLSMRKVGARVTVQTLSVPSP